MRVVEPGRAGDPQEGSRYVRVDQVDGVAIVSLDHPQDRNALSLRMTRELAEAVHGAAADDAIGAVVLAATGSVFSAGGSVDDLLEPKAPLAETYAGFVALLESDLPTVAAVNGPALGAGMNLALACDLMVCSPSSAFRDEVPRCRSPSRWGSPVAAAPADRSSGRSRSVAVRGDIGWRRGGATPTGVALRPRDRPARHSMATGVTGGRSRPRSPVTDTQDARRQRVRGARGGRSDPGTRTAGVVHGASRIPRCTASTPHSAGTGPRGESGVGRAH